MKLFRIEPKSELSNTVLQTIGTFPEKAEQIASAAELANVLNQNELCLIEKSGLEHLRIRSREQEKLFEERVQNILVTLQVPQHLKGFLYLKDAIKFLYDEPKFLNNMKKRLFAKVAFLNGTSASKVHRNIRNAVESTCKLGKIENLNQILKLHDGFFKDGQKIRNDEFIAMIANRLRVEFPW